MEPELKEFLTRIAKSISIILLWMLVNTLFGIKMGYIFLDEKITLWHVIYYIWLVASFIIIFLYIKKMWKNAPKFDQERGVWKAKNYEE